MDSEPETEPEEVTLLALVQGGLQPIDVRVHARAHTHTHARTRALGCRGVCHSGKVFSPVEMS